MLYRQPQQHNAVTAGATMHGPPSNQRSSAAVASQRHNVVSHTAHGDSFGRDYGYGNSTHHRHASPQEPAATQPTPRSFYPVHTEHNQTSPSGTILLSLSLVLSSLLLWVSVPVSFVLVVLRLFVKKHTL